MRLRKAGGLSYSRLRELSITKLRFDPALFDMRAFVMLVPLQQPMLVCKTDCLSDTVAGNQNLPKMNTLRISVKSWLGGLRTPGYIT